MESSSHNEKEVEEIRKYVESVGGRVIVNPYYPYQSSTNIKNDIRKQ